LFSRRRRHTSSYGDWSSDVCSSDLRAAADWIGQEPFLIVSGDALTDLDLGALLQQHGQAGAWLTLGLKHVSDPSEYGVVELDTRDRKSVVEGKSVGCRGWGLTGSVC